MYMYAHYMVCSYSFILYIYYCIINALKYEIIDGLSATCAGSQKSYLITNYLITKLSNLITNINYITEKLQNDPRL